ncbi:MAG TPA: hypothetical protein VHZ54_14455 [Solirubrobacterales bacterium]|nr:hypothetical protein [Solirubrobacterales bacterium]
MPLIGETDDRVAHGWGGKQRPGHHRNDSYGRCGGAPAQADAAADHPDQKASGECPGDLNEQLHRRPCL